MAKNTSAASGKAGGNEKVYFDNEASDLLKSLAVTSDFPKSRVVCALVRAASGIPPRRGEEVVFAILKRALGRDAFLHFLAAVGDTIGDAGDPLKPTSGDLPEAWIIQGHSTGVLAFFQPNEENMGELFMRASKMKAKHSLGCVLVVTTNGDIVAPSVRADLLAAGIEMVGLGDLRNRMADLKPSAGTSETLVTVAAKARRDNLAGTRGKVPRRKS